MTLASPTASAAGRSEAFRLLAALFCAPEQASLLAEDVGGRLAELLEELGSRAADAARELAASLQKADALALQVDHARLFVGPGELLAAPYGSVYLDEGRQLMGPSAQAALAAYEAAGLELEADQHELPDHVATELEFLHVLSWEEHEARSLGDLDAAQRLSDQANRFLSAHLGRWAGELAERMREGSGEPFYRHLADVLQTVIAEAAPAEPR